MGRALDNGLVRNSLFTQWAAKAGAAAKAKASAKEKGGDAPVKENVELAVDYSSPGFIITGLWSPAVARLNKFYDDINQSVVVLKIRLPTEQELKVNQLSYLMFGNMTIKDLSDRVRYKVNLNVCCPLKFSVDGNVLAEDSLVTSLLKNYGEEDGCIHLICDSSEDPVRYQWTLVQKKKCSKTKSGMACGRQLRRGERDLLTDKPPHTRRTRPVVIDEVTDDGFVIAPEVPFYEVLPKARTKRQLRWRRRIQKGCSYGDAVIIYPLTEVESEIIDGMVPGAGENAV